MTRAVPEWRGASDDTRPPPRVRLRVWEAKQGRCHKCTRKIRTGETWTLEHVKALINGGENRESNLDLTCSNCLPLKNAEDVAEKSASYKVRLKNAGIKTKKHLIAGSKGTKFRKKIDGTVEFR